MTQAGFIYLYYSYGPHRVRKEGSKMDEVQQWIRSVKKIQNPINRRIVKKQLMDHPAYLNSRHPLHREVTDAVRACIEVEVAEHKPNDGLDEVRQRYGDKNRLTDSQKRDLARLYSKGQFPDTIGPGLQKEIREIQAGMGIEAGQQGGAEE